MAASPTPGSSKGARLGLVVALTSAAIAAALFFLLFGGDDGSDPTGDVRTSEGAEPEDPSPPPADLSLADIAGARVERTGSRLSFVATMSEPIPRELERSSLEFRFDLSEEGRDTWIVAATVNVGAEGSVVSQVSPYGSSTIDDSMPGAVMISGETVTIEVDPSGIDDFPETFDWSLSTSLTAFRDTPGSTRFEDRYPDEGSVSGP